MEGRRGRPDSGSRLVASTFTGGGEPDVKRGLRDGSGRTDGRDTSGGRDVRRIPRTLPMSGPNRAAGKIIRNAK